MTEILTTVAVGIGVVELIWLKIQDLRRDIGGKIDAMRGDLDDKIDGVSNSQTSRRIWASSKAR